VNLVRTRKQDMLLPGLFFLGDTLALLAAALGTYGLRFGTGWFPVPLGVPPLRVYIWAALASCVTALVVFHQRGHYRLLSRGSLRRDLGGVATGLAVSLALLLSFLFFWRGFSFSRTFVAGYYVLACLLVLASRRLVRAWQARAAARGRGLLSVALLGESPMTAAVWRLFAAHPGFGYRPLGIIDAGGDAPADIPRLGGSEDLERIALERGLDAVVVTLPFRGYPRFVELAERLSAMNVKAFLVPDLEGLLTTRLHHFELEGIPFLAFRHVPLAGLGRVLKRAVDIAASALGLILLAPLLGVIALAVLAGDGRPVLYSQVRLGRDGRRFRIRKFRSMRRDAEAGGAGWTVAGDPRRTRLGAWLRRTSLDELPQLWNVLVGEMSLVGPRPERPEFAAGFSRRIPRYFERHRVRSGITGWAQVNGLRGDTPIEVRTRYDLFYVENWSLAFDLKILWLTLRSVLVRRGA
jgi:exopolysaccharide biosynthesis polyprenyl glycosylphosphotransferase